MSKRRACTRALLDEALASGAITTFSTPSHSHTDVDTLGVAVTKTMPVVPPGESLKPSIVLEPEAAEPVTATDITSDCGSDNEEGAKPSPETWRVLQSFADILPQLHDLMMEHEGDLELNEMCECREATRSTRCEDCIEYRLTCTQCFIRNHRHSWNHWALVWDVRGIFTRKDIHELGYVPQLGHHGAECPVPHNPVKMIVVDVNGIHDTCLRFCGCQSLTVDRVSQLMHACLFLSTTNLPQLAFSFQLLWQFQLLHIECTTTMHDMMGAWQRLTDNKFPWNASDATKQIRRVFRVWNLMKAERRAGIVHHFDALIPHRQMKNLLVRCPACPEAGWNLEPGSDTIPQVFRHMNQLQLTGDGNFHVNKAEANPINSDPEDLPLVGGRGVYPDRQEWENYLKEAEAIKPKGGGKKVPCNNHKAVTSQNARFENCKYTGVAQVQCSHVFVRATADFLKGENQRTMDNALHRALLLANLASDQNDSIDIVFSYDINCQYCVHIAEWWEAPTLKSTKHHVVRSVKMIPLCHIKGHQDQCNEDFNPVYLVCIGHFHSETAEQFWAFSNGLGPQIHQMNLEHGHEIYFHQANDWNYRKVINMSQELTKDILYARKQFAVHESYFCRLTASLPAEQVHAWEKLLREPPRQGSRCSVSKDYISPYRHRKQKVPSMDSAIETLLLNPRRLVAIGAGSDEAAEFISEGINLEQQQRHLQMLIDKEKAYPNETDQETIRRKSTSLEKSMKHWFELHIKFMGVASKFSLPSGTGINDAPTENKPEQLTKKKKKKKKASGRANVESWPLGLPSSLSLDDDKVRLKPLIEYETKLREGAAFDSLHAVLLAADQLQALGYDKSKNVRGYKPNTKAQEKLR
ncbi:uncharacterized protein ARMOST_18808 [Armillaria ostoyae]|uniref:CxC2-like cysteine cluster KDZ transposase-associated domain-containing protein n=1 Tax=Armillaria ostoyae TaxID=47428 RepID=A0A284S2T8_ARMOS|nr:uncharacterized protein ARMOST_18808 [Armillaria ostoyae]